MQQRSLRLKFSQTARRQPSPSHKNPLVQLHLPVNLRAEPGTSFLQGASTSSRSILPEQLLSPSPQMAKYKVRHAIGKRLSMPEFEGVPAYASMPGSGRLPFGSGKKLLSSIVTSPLKDGCDLREEPYYATILEEARALFKAKNRKLSIEKMKEIIVMSTRQNDFMATGASFILCALMEYYNHDYSSACEYLVQLRNVGNSIQDNVLKLLAYKYLGLCFHHLNMHEFALRCFKKQLDLAWEARDVASELESYDYIGMQFYYLGDVEKASYYHDRMMRSEGESARSELRQHRHKFVFRFIGGLRAVNYTNVREVLKRQYQKYYVKTGSQPGTPAAGGEKNYFSASTQRFFTTQRQKGFFGLNSESRDISTVAASTHAPPRLVPVPDELISANPADLSLSDLPSPRFNGDNNMPAKRRSSNYRCPAVVAYINRKSKRMEQNAIRARSTQKKLPTAQERLAKWQADLAKKASRAHWSSERVQDRGPNQPAVVTHMSPSRPGKKPYYEKLIKIIYKLFDAFPGRVKAVLLHKL